MPGLLTPIQLIIGLGNPGPEYAKTRHNAGAWFVQQLAQDKHLNLRLENKFHGWQAIFNQNNTHRVHLFIPNTFMNLSGKAVKSVADFYQIAPENMLIVHDEIDLPTGETRLKFGGGHGGHNGLRDIIAQLHTNNFYRLRIGVGHPGIGQKHLVVDYVLSPPSREEYAKILDSMRQAEIILPDLLEGNFDKAAQKLHTKIERKDDGI